MTDSAVLKEAQSLISAPLKSAGYRKQASTWRHASPESICVVNLQRSQWSQSYYINLGVFYSALGVLTTPQEYHCHIRCRLDSLSAGNRDELVHALDMERPMDLEHRRQIASSSLIRYALPWLGSFATVGSARHILQGAVPQGFIITLAAKELLLVSRAN